MKVSSLIPARKELESLAVYNPGKPIEEVKRELGLDSIIKLASNENPFGASKKVKQALDKEFQHISLYPESTAPILSKKLSEKWRIHADSILIGNGSDEIIRMLTKCYIRPGDEAVMAEVTFPRYETCVLMEGGKPVLVPLVDGVHHLEAMYDAINEKTRMVFVCNPNNPTGTIVDKKRLQRFIESIPAHVLVIIDEAYYEYMEDDVKLNTHELIEKHPNLIVTRTFSKIYGLASLRIGYGMMNSEIIQTLIKVKDPFNSNRFAQAAALAALEDEPFIEQCRTKNIEGLRYMEAESEKLNLHYFPSSANFIMIHLHQSGQRIYEELLKRGVIVRSGTLLGFPNSIRVTVGTEKENKQFITALKEVIDRGNFREN
ncbi:histidinol-phosphate transaminase [Bacillus sp. FJAT-47783]|uniref:histidinol-phosphate transaminase n=1 Tax=Bacillus sp. FJAT-47783 TaxID=2922712 RepID=UPI001FAD1453|nr:histidinol-phosphate transaminase [Bacillus sp. FJAT-47783]